MKRTQTIWLVISAGDGVERMTKRQPGQLGRGEHPVKVTVEYDTEALRPPMLETRVLIEDWRQGLDVGDINMKQATITATEAEAIRRMRRQAMVEQMQELGYTVIPPEESGDSGA